MNIIEKKLNEITPYEKNPRKNDEAVKYVAESIKQFGFKVPIVIDKDGVIVCGHTRYKASRKLHLETVPCIVADDLTEEQLKAYRLADNKVSEKAEWDMDLLDFELSDIFDVDMSALGFEVDDLNADDLDTDFTLADGDKSEICQMTFTLHNEQKALIEKALTMAKKEIVETFGNENSNGNALYEVVRQWEEQRT